MRYRDFQIRKGRAPSCIAAQTSDGAIPQLVPTLISTNKIFFAQIDERTMETIQAIAFLARKMGARVELLEPFTAPWGAKNFSLPQNRKLPIGLGTTAEKLT